jgi:hypothetical protein
VSECPLSEQVLQEVEHVVSLRGRPRSLAELPACIGPLDQLTGLQLVKAGAGAKHGVRLLCIITGSDFLRRPCWGEEMR